MDLYIDMFDLQYTIFLQYCHMMDYYHIYYNNLNLLKNYNIPSIQSNYKESIQNLYQIVHIHLVSIYHTPMLKTRYNQLDQYYLVIDIHFFFYQIYYNKQMKYHYDIHYIQDQIGHNHIYLFYFLFYRVNQIQYIYMVI